MLDSIRPAELRVSLLQSYAASSRPHPRDRDESSELEQQASVRQAELVEPVMERITAVIEEILADDSAADALSDLPVDGVLVAQFH